MPTMLIIICFSHYQLCSMTYYKQFNEHLDYCLMSSQQNANRLDDYRGIKYWEKVQNEQGFQWVLKEYNPTLQINEQVFNILITTEYFLRTFRIKIGLVQGQIRKAQNTVASINFTKCQNGCTTISVSQNHLIETSVDGIIKMKSRLLHGELKIKFQEDLKVQDAGGLLREWSTSILQKLVDLGYLKKTDTQELTYRFNPIVQGHSIDKRSLFSFLGIIVGKCLFERIPLSSYFDRTIIKHMIKQQIILDDIKYFDEEVNRSVYSSYFIHGNSYQTMIQSSQIQTFNWNIVEKQSIQKKMVIQSKLLMKIFKNTLIYGMNNKYQVYNFILNNVLILIYKIFSLDFIKSFQNSYQKYSRLKNLK
ncbi:hypothetical protein FGO68_gene10807 [Halteria grandinella]|uniref:HECT-type E3 ubiquitin transferase n=1 Tax=Halteria grandinella TaxID=5974 RepID=A0A8J8SXP3_HALGN|nr:hypothetical protein FGO68_gene10807 [Halteria grandinella]